MIIAYITIFCSLAFCFFCLYKVTFINTKDNNQTDYKSVEDSIKELQLQNKELLDRIEYLEHRNWRE